MINVEVQLQNRGYCLNCQLIDALNLWMSSWSSYKLCESGSEALVYISIRALTSNDESI